MSAVLRRVADHALSLGALLGLAALLGATLGAALGVRPLVFRSGSMAPAIGTGSLALARSVPAEDLRAGDVVSVLTASGSRVTHRVVGTQQESGHTVLTLRGDANRVSDPESYVVDSAYRVFWHVPWVGYAVGAALTPPGLFLLGVGVTGLLVLAGRGGARGPRPRGGRRARRARRAAPHRHRARRAGATAVAAMAVVAGPAGPASAGPWTDAVSISGTALTAGTVAAPVVACGTLIVGTTTLTWTAVPGATSYTLHYDTGGVTTETVGGGVTSKSFGGLATSGDFSVNANVNYGSTTWVSARSNVKHYTVLLFLVGVCTDA
jgi:signal peptidase I